MKDKVCQMESVRIGIAFSNGSQTKGFTLNLKTKGSLIGEKSGELSM